MTVSVADAQQGLLSALAELRATAGSKCSDEELLSTLVLCETATRQLDRLAVDVVAEVDRLGLFTRRGYRSAVNALGDLLGWERFEARRRVLAAESVCARTGLDGTPRPARLGATAAVFSHGATSLRHVEVVAKVLGTHAAARLTPEVWEAAERQLADKATEYTPTELFTWGTALVEALDADGAEPDDRQPAQVNELHLIRFRTRPGGRLASRFDDAALFDTIAAVVDAGSQPRSADEERSTPQRQAEALAEACAQVLDRGRLPETGGHRPHLNVLVRLEDLENRCRAAALDFGGTLTPEALRMLACDAAVVPIVLDGAGQPLDVGRLTRVVPDGLRRAVAARDAGCAHPGCDRPPSWCEVHHVLAWENGGRTELGNLVMACKIHHRLLHHSEWIVRIRDGLPEFIPPRWIDRTRTPRRKPSPQLARLAGSGPGRCCPAPSERSASVA